MPVDEEITKAIKEWPMPEPEVRMTGIVRTKDGKIKHTEEEK